MCLIYIGQQTECATMDFFIYFPCWKFFGKVLIKKKRLLTPVCPGVFMNKTKKRGGYMWDLYVRVFETN